MSPKSSRFQLEAVRQQPICPRALTVRGGAGAVAALEAAYEIKAKGLDLV